MIATYLKFYGIIKNTVKKVWKKYCGKQKEKVLLEQDSHREERKKQKQKEKKRQRERKTKSENDFVGTNYFDTS